MQLRILTYNIHKGFCFYSRQYVLRELRTAIRNIEADIVFLQEVMGVHPEPVVDSDLESQFEYLADQTWPHFAYGKNAVYSDGHHGNAILSKFKFTAFQNINVSTNPLEQRGILHGQIELPGQRMPVHVLCLHFDLLDRGRRLQLDSLVERVKATVDSYSPLVVAGDFNDWREKLSDPLVEELGLKEAGVKIHGKHVKTFPSWKPLLALDRVYTRGLQVVSHRVLSKSPWRTMSDHAAVVVDLEIKD